jgi:hypothetical protein
MLQEKRSGALGKEDRWVGEDEQRADEKDENGQYKRDRGLGQALNYPSKPMAPILPRDDTNINTGHSHPDMNLRIGVTWREPPQEDATFLVRPLTPNPQMANSRPDPKERLRPSTPNSPPSPRTYMTEMIERRTAQNPIPQSPSVAPRKTDIVDMFLSDDFIDLAKDPAILEKDRKILRELRVDSFKRRGELRTKRQRLQRQESIKIEADAAFMKFVTIHMSEAHLRSRTPLKQPENFIYDLNTYYAAMQAARNEYGPMEDDYNELTESLDELEFKLVQAESRVYKTPRDATTIPATSTATNGVPSDKSSELSWQDEQTYHPLHAKLLDKLGDLDLAVERSDYLKQRLDYDQRALRENGAATTYQESKVSEELKASVEDLSNRLITVEQEIAKIFSEVEVLKAECEEEGIYLQTHSQYAEDFLKDIDSLDAERDNYLDGSASTNSGEPDERTFTLLFPTLADKKKDLKTLITEFDEINLSNPNKFPVFLGKETDLDVFITQFDEDNKSDRINRWLLHGLWISPLGIDLFAQIIVDIVNIDINKLHTDITRWQNFIASTWFVDGANYPPGRFIQPPSQTCVSRRHSAPL